MGYVDALEFPFPEVFPLYSDEGFVLSELKDKMKREKLPVFLKEMGEVIHCH